MQIHFVIDGESFIIEAHGEGHTLLNLGLIAKVPLPFSCMEGSCGTCMARLDLGETTETPDKNAKIRLCQALPRSSSIKVVYD